MSILGGIAKDAGATAAQTIADALPGVESTVKETAAGLESTAQEISTNLLAALADGIGQLLNLGRALDGATVTSNITITTTIKLAPEVPKE